MDITFDKGSPDSPKGHALAYFKVDTEPDKVYGTYVVVLPVKADLSKYVPPFLASHLGNMPLNDFTAFAMPPMPEPMESYQEVERLAGLRDDDLVYGSNMFSYDLPRMMEAVNEVVQEYSRLCTSYFQEAPTQQPQAPAGAPQSSSYQVNEVLFSLMSESDKLSELSRLLGKLRFGQQGQDQGMIGEAKEEIGTLGRYLPEHYRVADLLEAAADSSSKSAQLTQLYLDRCYRLSAGDDSGVSALDAQIESLKAQE